MRRLIEAAMRSGRAARLPALPRRALRACGWMLLAPSLCLGQADYAREQRWAAEITPGILVGDPMSLQTARGHRFLAIYAAHAPVRAGVIVVHGMGAHPDWGLINILRTRLSDGGYSTLSVQMPVLAAGAPAEDYPAVFPEAAERLAAAVAFLRSRGASKVAIVAHSMGARMVDYYLTRGPGAAVDAWVAIGIPLPYADPVALKMPVLDIYGERDFPAVLQQAPRRAAALRSTRGSGQVEVAGADHFFDGMEADLERRIRQFLEARLRP